MGGWRGYYDVVFVLFFVKKKKKKFGGGGCVVLCVSSAYLVSPITHTCICRGKRAGRGQIALYVTTKIKDRFR